MKLELGNWKITSHVVDNFSLDGGAMFGQVPKTLWSKRIEPDDSNRIPLCSRVLLVETDREKVLIEAGCGRKWSDKLKKIYDITYLEELSEICSAPTHVVATHLHFDHAAGLVKPDGGLQFPEAFHVFSELNYRTAKTPPTRESASYLPENIDPLSEARLMLLDDGDEIVPGVTVHQYHGHTAGLQCVKITNAGKTVVFPADLIPTAHHVDILWVMGYDAYAAQSVEEKKSFLKQALDGNWIIVFGHDRHTAAASIKLNEKGKYEVARTYGG